MDYGPIVMCLYVLVWINGPYVAIFTHMWIRCGHCIILGTGCHVIAHVAFWLELPVQRRLCPIFVKSGVPGKRDSMVWCRFTRHPRIFRGLTGCQQTPRIWGVTDSKMIKVHDMI